MLTQIWKWIDHNRFIVICPGAALLLWVVAVGCEPITASPLDPARSVNAKQLELDLKIWQKQIEITQAKFEAAGEDLAEQKANNAKITEFILNLAGGGVADLPGLIQLLVGGGAIGAITDNIRKRGLIAGLKRNA